MEDLLKMERYFKRTRIITIIALVTMGLIALTATAMSYINAREYSKRIYIVDKNKQFEALTASTNTNLPVEITYHVGRFHELFFNLAPDSKQIEENTKKAFFLCDESAKKFYDNLKEQNFYNEIIQGNVVQKIQVDSVSVESSVYPYKATCYAHIEQTRSSGRQLKGLISTCTLEETPRSVNSPNGLFMRNFNVVNIYNER